MKIINYKFLTVSVLIIYISCNNSNIQPDLNPQSDPVLVSQNEYTLPYAPGKQYTVLQGNNNPAGTHNGLFKFSYDLNMSIGDTIIAIRDGVVVFVKEQFTDQEATLQAGNKVVVEHEDGSMARYVHLTHMGVLKEIGTVVERGEPIAISGDSGLGGPHLHIDVINIPDAGCGPTYCAGEFCQTRLTIFKNAFGSQNEPLQQARTYLALPYIEQ